MNSQHNLTRPRGAGRARARGFSLVELLIVVAIIGIIAAIAVPNILSSRRAANEASAISALRTLTSSEMTYRETYGAGHTYADLAGLRARNFIDAVLANATSDAAPKSGYIYLITLSADSTSYVIGSSPTSALTGSRRFSTDTPGVIYYDKTDITTVPTAAAGTPIN